MSIAETFDEIKDVIKDRIKSPVIGIFIFTWLGANWRAVYITLFVSEDQLNSNKLEYILQNTNLSYLDNLIWPFFLAMVISLLYPLINLLLAKVLNNIRIKKYYDERNRAEKEIIDPEEIHFVMSGIKSAEGYNNYPVYVKLLLDVLPKPIEEKDIHLTGLMEHLLLLDLVKVIEINQGEVIKYFITNKGMKYLRYLIMQGRLSIHKNTDEV